MILNFKRLSLNAKLPQRQKSGDAGFDLMATSRTIGMNHIEYTFGVSVEIPEGHVGLLIPRSSISDTNVFLSNSVGVIDSNFRGEIKARFKRDGGAPKMPGVGERIVQLVILPLPAFESSWKEELTRTEREGEGFGSSGSGLND